MCLPLSPPLRASRRRRPTLLLKVSVTVLCFTHVFGLAGGCLLVYTQTSLIQALWDRAVYAYLRIACNWRKISILLWWIFCYTHPVQQSRTIAIRSCNVPQKLSVCISSLLFHSFFYLHLSKVVSCTFWVLLRRRINKSIQLLPEVHVSQPLVHGIKNTSKYLYINVLLLVYKRAHTSGVWTSGA